MAAYILKYHRTRERLLDVVEFPDGFERAARCNAKRYAESAPEAVEIHVFHADGIAELVRKATADELSVDSEAAVAALLSG